MKKRQEKLEDDYAEALKRLPFFVEFKDARYTCVQCKNIGVKIKYFYLLGKQPFNTNFCSQSCLNMYLIRRL
jgi:hypothetical protein